MVGVLGNNDVGDASRTRAPAPGGPAYYLYWNQPLNGPDVAATGHVPFMQPVAPWQDFLSAAGSRFPVMGTFSFDMGDVHWTVLDSNFYMNWRDPALLGWLRQDLQAAQARQWRFVVFHHPAFNLGSVELGWRQHRMRALWPYFEDGKVDLVFTGHIHAYQRTRPLRYQPRPAGVSPENHFMDPARMIIDTAFDGAAQTRAQGPIHIVTGGGGAHLHGVHRPAAGPRPFDAALVGDKPSFSTLELMGPTLVFKQVDTQGRTLDTFTLTK